MALWCSHHHLHLTILLWSCDNMHRFNWENICQKCTKTSVRLEMKAFLRLVGLNGLIALFAKTSIQHWAHLFFRCILALLLPLDLAFGCFSLCSCLSLQRISSNLLLMKQTPPHGDNDLLHAPNSVIYTRHITAARPCSNTAGHRTHQRWEIYIVAQRMQVYSVGFVYSHSPCQANRNLQLVSFNQRVDRPTNTDNAPYI